MAMVGKKHDALHRPADPVTDWDDAVQLAARMRVTLGRQNGSGLAAAQVGRPLNLIVLDQRLGGRAFANIELEWMGGKSVVAPEGCLTMPGRWFAVPRWTKVTVTAVDVDDPETPVRLEVRDDWEARVWQHEDDHLKGLLIVGRFDAVPAP